MSTQSILKKVLNKKATNIKIASITYNVKEEDTDVPVGVNSLISASKKLLAINRGQTDPDERDSLRYKKIYNTDDLIKERIDLDAGKLKNILMFNLSKNKSLKYFKPGYFDSYALGHIVGNSLSSPSEEINPLQILEQAYRVTQLGEGGIGSEQAVTVDAQNVHPSIFSFIDPSETPESNRAGIDVRLVPSVRLGYDGNPYTKVKDKRTGRYVWLNPDEIGDAIVAFPQ